MRNTIVILKYKRYEENVIVTEKNVGEVLNLVLGDKDVIDYEYLVEGDASLGEEVGKSDIACHFTPPPKAATVLKMVEKVRELESEYCHTDSEAIKMRTRVGRLKDRIAEKVHKLTMKELLFV